MFNLPNWLRRVRGRKCSRCGARVRRYVVVGRRTWCEPCTQRAPQQFLEELKASPTFETQDNAFISVGPHSARLVRVSVPLDALEALETATERRERELDAFENTGW